MKSTLIIGVVLILMGAAMLAYEQFSYRTRETVLEVGPLKATAERTKTVALPPILGWALIGGGAVVLVFSARSKT
jgi:hypothetical protein